MPQSGGNWNLVSAPVSVGAGAALPPGEQALPHRDWDLVLCTGTWKHEVLTPVPRELVVW